ncbi:MAG: helix-hairpin-helix domain-containing protein [Anaerolineales bacterium]|nr:helix-hairpin-helix domain-containing protein [Anaerolineales bacterium]
MKTPWVIILSVITGFVLAGVVLLVGSPPRGEVIRLLPPPTPEPLVIDIQGAVNAPGVYTLDQGSRVFEAIEQAGGYSAEAAQGKLNLASVVRDGMLIYVPAENDPDSLIKELNSDLYENNEVQNSVININVASVEELMNLPGIGESKAQAIVDYRNVNGLFGSIEEIQNVPGVGPSIYNNLKDYITIGK